MEVISILILNYEEIFVSKLYLFGSLGRLNKSQYATTDLYWKSNHYSEYFNIAFRVFGPTQLGQFTYSVFKTEHLGTYSIFLKKKMLYLGIKMKEVYYINL